MTSPINPTDEWLDLKEKLAAIEHERWADWQKWCHKRLRDQLGSGNGVLEGVLEQWERQIATPYEKLPEAEKQSDRDQVDRYWPLILSHFQAKELEGRIEELDKLIDLANVRQAIKDPGYPVGILDLHEAKAQLQSQVQGLKEGS